MEKCREATVLMNIHLELGKERLGAIKHEQHRIYKQQLDKLVDFKRKELEDYLPA